MDPTPIVFGVVIGNRDCVPDKGGPKARADLLELFGELGLRAVMLHPAEAKLGGVHDDFVAASASTPPRSGVGPRCRRTTAATHARR